MGNAAADSSVPFAILRRGLNLGLRSVCVGFINGHSLCMYVSVCVCVYVFMCNSCLDLFVYGYAHRGIL